MPSKELPAPPDDPSTLDPLIAIWPAGQSLCRVHATKRAANAFNPGFGQGRFHPFHKQAGRMVPTLYASDQIDGALSETVFRGIPSVGSLRGIRKQNLAGLVLSTLRPTRDLRLADLRGHGLRRLGLQRNQLLETEASHYQQSAAWAGALHRADTTLDGLIWVSRQFDTATVMVLFGDRVKRRSLVAEKPALDLYRGRGLQQVLLSAESANLVVLS